MEKSKQQRPKQVNSYCQWRSERWNILLFIFMTIITCFMTFQTETPCIYVYICLFVYTHTHTHTHRCAQTRARTHARAHARARAHTHTHSHTCTHINTHSYSSQFSNPALKSTVKSKNSHNSQNGQNALFVFGINTKCLRHIPKYHKEPDRPFHLISFHKTVTDWSVSFLRKQF